MTLETDEKVRAMPMEKRLAFLENLEHLRECHRKQNELLDELKASMMSQWVREFVEKRGFDNVRGYWKDGQIRQLVNRIEEAKFHGRDTVRLGDESVTVTWAQCVLEEVERVLKHRDDWPQQIVYAIRSHWKRRHREREEARFEAERYNVL